MKASGVWFRYYILLLSIVMSFDAKSYAQTAAEVIKKSEEKMRGNTLQGTMTVKIIRPSWTREVNLKMWLKGDDYAMALILAPEKDKGITFLRRSKEVWNWIPALEKIIKLPPSMMSQSWMGTDFSNDYLVKESSLTTDFDASFGKDSMVDGRNSWKIVLTPKESAAVVWGKVVLFIDKADYLQLRNEYYDEDGELINTLHGTNIGKMGGRIIPTVFEMIPSAKPGNKTTLIYQAITFDQAIDDNFFTTQNMKQLK